ncbi:hypothetical protein PHMEG_00014626 [Phytophthora megakarya]|uniref:DDE-1 domain-containing protein n=1 Tax=Phytophthora megakarya TaxID=4795 RepID=A0A225W4W5_9STRA|nr:hypothetical protein PHMEG_00014626 [Phytophthora megakarya]
MLSAEWLREKVSTTRTAKQMRRGVVMRTIRAWKDISPECVVKSFEKTGTGSNVVAPLSIHAFLHFKIEFAGCVTLFYFDQLHMRR